MKTNISRMQGGRRARFRKHSTKDVSNNHGAQLNGTDIYIQKYDMTSKGYKKGTLYALSNSEKMLILIMHSFCLV